MRIIKQSGDWDIREIDIKKDGKDGYRGAGFESSPPGKYLVLYHKTRKSVMTNNLMEMDDQEEFLSVAKGDVIVGGLGLGLIVDRLEEKEGIKSITVIESDIDIIKLNTPFEWKKTQIIHGDVRSFSFNEEIKSPDFVFLDIWDDCESSSYEDRLSVLDYWNQYCKKCYVWALDRSKNKNLKEQDG